MKHPSLPTIMIVLLFLCAEFVGLFILQSYLQTPALYLVEPPQVENESFSFIPILFSVLIGTIIILLLARYKLYRVWKIWFLLSMWIALSFGLYPFLSSLFGTYLFWFFLFTFALALLKIYWKNAFYHNISELFVYGGIVSLFLPIINIVSAAILLVLISVYDAYAVWKSKHMVTLAKFQTEGKLFAGLVFDYGKRVTVVKKSSVASKVANVNNDAVPTLAILGGGDIAFPLIFAAGLLKSPFGMTGAVFVVIGAAAGLLWLLLISKPGRFYPAMPFITSGIIVGSSISYLISHF